MPGRRKTYVGLAGDPIHRSRQGLQAKCPCGAGVCGCQVIECPTPGRKDRRVDLAIKDAQLQHEIVLKASDRVGVLAEACGLLSEMGISLLSVGVFADNGTARIHLVTSSQSYARDALRSAGFEIEERDVVMIELPHRSGFLCRVIEALARKDISVRTLQATVSEESTTGVVVFTCSNNARAVQMLRGR